MCSVVAIRAHQDSEHLRAMIDLFRTSLGDDMVYVIFDATRNRPPPGPRVLTFTEEECQRVNPYHKDNWFNAEYPVSLLRTALAETGAQFAWLIESDVGCDGLIAACLDKCTSTADFMAFQVRSYDAGSNADWAWWTSIRGEIATVPLHDRMACFFPVTRYSVAMVNAVSGHMGASSGHCEAYIPTLAVAKGLRVENLPLSMHGNVGFTVFDALPGKEDNRLYHKFMKHAHQRPPQSFLFLCFASCVLLLCCSIRLGSTVPFAFCSAR